MLPEIEQLASKRPDDVCFTFQEADGSSLDMTYGEVKLKANALVAALAKRGITAGSTLPIDMENCPAFVVCILAAAYGGFTLVALNHRLTKDEKVSRLAGISSSVELTLLTEQDVENVGIGVLKRSDNKQGDARTSSTALVMFTSGSSSQAKAVPLTWENLCGAATASNSSLNKYGEGKWQAALPLYHIGGFEIVVRSILNATPFILYRRFDAKRVLEDASDMGATHISVVDKMLQDLVQADDGQLAKYSCILLGGAAINPKTLSRALESGASVYASYGMTETSSQIASTLVTNEFNGSLDLLAGYEVKVVNKNAQGVGQLAVKGPGVFFGYLNATASFTPDGYFLTGDSATYIDGRLKVQERVNDMFVSGGENVSPAEIQEALMSTLNVTDAHVFGAPDETWGRRPIAFVESDKRNEIEALLLSQIDKNLSKISRPKQLFMLDSFPRIGIGKVDRQGLQQMYEQRIELSEVRLYHINQELVAPIKTAKVNMQSRESLIVEVVDTQGRTGVAEGVAFSTDWYLPETLSEDKRILEQYLIPLVLQQTYLHPSEVSRHLDKCKAAGQYPMAKAAIEPALWDLYGKITKKSIRQLIGAELESCEATALAGAVIGIMPLQETITAIESLVKQGYTRVKLKVQNAKGIELARAVRECFPNLMIMLDANQAFTESDVAILQSLDNLNIRCIEEPLTPKNDNSADIFTRLERLQENIKTPICLDESIITQGDIDRVLNSPNLRCIALKIAKWGGLTPALRFYERALKLGFDIWMGGMYESGVSKNMHAAFETLPGIEIPGDLSSTSHYFKTDICEPKFSAQNGLIYLNLPGHENGLGCVLDHESINQILVEKKVFKRD